ncbi:hypothetical protein P2R95_22390, partial [Escherichia coli]
MSHPIVVVEPKIVREYFRYDIPFVLSLHPSSNDTRADYGFAPIFPDTCYHLTHYWPAAADIPV